jgi:voltage-gated potassium channel
MFDRDRQRPTLHQVVFESDTRIGRAFDLVIQSLIIVSLVSFSIETLPDLSPQTRRLLRYVEVGTVAIFTVEYVLRVIAARNKWGFIFSFFGIVDLVAIAPFYLATGLDLRAIRIFRLFRLFRAFKLFRYGRAIARAKATFHTVRDEIVLYVLASLFLIYLAAVGIYYFENRAQPDAFSDVFSSLWWAIVTLTTVGYGDVYPITLGGRLFTTVVLFIGLGVVAVPAGLVASALSRVLEAERRPEDH